MSLYCPEKVNVSPGDAGKICKTRPLAIDKLELPMIESDNNVAGGALGSPCSVQSASPFSNPPFKAISQLFV